MKTIDYYLNLPYKLEIVPDKDEGGYAARYPELPGCITVGDTLPSLTLVTIKKALIHFIIWVLEPLYMQENVAIFLLFSSL